jgi:hypothetical protein
MEWEEPRELDSENEAVISMYDGIKKILAKQGKTKPRKSLKVPEDAKDETHVLHCGRIIKIDVERKIVVITVEKADGEVSQLRIEAYED